MCAKVVSRCVCECKCCVLFGSKQESCEIRSVLISSYIFLYPESVHNFCNVCDGRFLAFVLNLIDVFSFHLIET